MKIADLQHHPFIIAGIVVACTLLIGTAIWPSWSRVPSIEIVSTPTPSSPAPSQTAATPPISQEQAAAAAAAPHEGLPTAISESPRLPQEQTEPSSLQAENTPSPSDPEPAKNAQASGAPSAAPLSNSAMGGSIPEQDEGDAFTNAAWTRIAPGLWYGEFESDEGDARITAVRIDPACYDFVLCAAGEQKEAPRPLSRWATETGLMAAINASMYLPDGLTSTGYMRNGSYINNKAVVQRFGAFFVAGPDSPDLPRAAILDRDGTDWKTLISHYTIVIQNYRMITAQRRIVWSPGGPLYSISAVAQDGDGRILFLHSRDKIEAYTFAQHLLHLPFDIRTVMYVEGGGQAGLFVQTPVLAKELRGKSNADFLVTGNVAARLPNILGIKPRTGK